VHRCLEDGIYWTYDKPKYKPTDLADLEEGEIIESSLRKQISEGILSAPKVSWCSWSHEEWEKIVERARRLEGERMTLERENSMRRIDAERRMQEEVQVKQKADAEARERAAEEAEE
jgi:hypothetical protein